MSPYFSGMKQLLLVALLLLSLPANAETVLVEAGRDATLIEDPDGAWANGSGPFLFAGRTTQDQNGIRRGDPRCSERKRTVQVERSAVGRRKFLPGD